MYCFHFYMYAYYDVKGIFYNWSLSGGLPWWLSGKEPTCQCRRLAFDPWVRKIPWRGKWQPTPVFLPGNPKDRGSWWATVHEVAKESDMTERLYNITNTYDNQEPQIWNKNRGLRDQCRNANYFFNMLAKKRCRQQ